jgi:hypothetical protein
VAPSLRGVLIRLSSRQMKHGVEHTEPALLAGLWALLQGLALAEEFDLDHLRQILHDVLFGPEGLPGPAPIPQRTSANTSRTVSCQYIPNRSRATMPGK